MYSSHYMYLGLVTFFHTLYLFDIYIYIYIMMMYVFHFISRVVYFLSLYMFLGLYSLSIFHIRCLNESC